MPYGYLIGVVLMALLVLAALRPPRHPLWLARLTYFAGLAINEFPVLFLALLTWSTLDTVLLGDSETTIAEWAVVGVAAVVIAGMVYLQVRSTRARPAISAALGTPIRPTVSPWLSRLLPITLRPRGVERRGGIRYAPGGREHTLDVYRRRDLVAPAPVLVYFHAGGYFSGNKRWGARLLLHRMAARGWIVVSANYGLRPRTGYPGHVIDAKRVIAWIHREAEQYDMDATTIVVAGSSAGAHLATIAALSSGDPAFQPGFEDVDTRLAAAIGLFGYYGRYYGRPATERPASTPFAFDTRHAPPIMLVHGDLDNYTPVETARALAAHLEEGSSEPVVYAELPGAQHGFDLAASERFQAVVDGVEAFLDRVLAERAQRARSDAAAQRRPADR